MKLSIAADSYTQPAVAWPVGPDHYKVVDSFHRHRVAKEDQTARGRLPVTVVNADRTEQADRMAATLRHNRARGQHTVDGAGVAPYLRGGPMPGS